MNIFTRIQKFSGENTDEMLALSTAYIGEVLQKMAAEKIFRPLKISTVQYNVLCSLSVQSPRAASEISESILGSAPNFSAVLRRMEKENFITREFSPNDKREVLVAWTPKGEKIFEAVRKNFQKFFAEKFEKIPESEKKQIIAVLQNFSKYL